MPLASRVLPFVAGLVFAACHTPEPAPAPSPEASVKPGINTDFLDPALDVTKYEQRFEVESREVFAHRGAIAALAGVRTGMHVADVGAGTGLFTLMFATKVGTAGRVYAVDIAETFVRHCEAAATARGLTNVQGVVCGERDVALPAASVDLVFVCDTYHHFEYPQSTLASVHRALRDGGDLVVVDFHRIPGVSRQWLLDHVRAGHDEVVREIEAAGFRRVRDEATPFLQENWMTRFAKGDS
jgi:predicted methyltransferase